VAAAQVSEFDQSYFQQVRASVLIPVTRCTCTYVGFKAVLTTSDGIVPFPDPQQDPMPVRESGNETSGRDEGRERGG